MNQQAAVYPNTNYQYGYQYNMENPGHYYPAPMQAADWQQQTNEMHEPQYLHQQQYWVEPVNDHSLFNRWFDYKNDQWIKGAIVGAAAAVLLTNSTVQKTIAKGVLGLWGTMQSGIEEFKEQIRDIQAENNEK